MRVRRPHDIFDLPDLPLGARPTMLLYEFVGVGVAGVVHHRALRCGNYDKCLGWVVCANWVNFSCRGCRFFEANRVQRDQDPTEVEEELWTPGS